MTVEGAAAATGMLGAPRQLLRTRDALALTVGIVIGAGIFRTPALVAQSASSETALLLAWGAGGLLSIIGALCYAELASAFPSVGGDVHFLERAFGRRVGFLYGWARLAVIQTGSVALLAYVVGDYASVIAPLGPMSSTFYAAATVLLVCLLNWIGVRLGAGLQRWLTVIEVAGLVALILAGLFIASPAPAAASCSVGGSAFGAMMVLVLLTYGGWSETAYLSAEIRGPRRRIAAAMIGGLFIVALLYLLANLAFLRSLGLGGLAQENAPAATVMRLAFGAPGEALISLAVAIAALTSANATVITGARSTCALGRSFGRLGWIGRWDELRDTPGNAILLLGLVSLLLVVAGAFARSGFQLAVDYTTPVFWGFLLLVGIGLFVLRRREPDTPRPFRVPLYPALPAIFCLTCCYMLYASLAYTGAGAIIGLGVLASGVALLLLKPIAARE